MVCKSLSSKRLKLSLYKYRRADTNREESVVDKNDLLNSREEYAGVDNGEEKCHTCFCKQRGSYSYYYLLILRENCPNTELFLVLIFLHSN